MNRYGTVLMLAGLGILLLIMVLVFPLRNVIGASFTDEGTGILLLLLSALIASTTFLIASGIYLHRKVFAPLSDLLTGAAEIGRGNLDHRIPARGAREIAVIGERFNEMAAKLSNSRAELERLGGLGRLGSAIRHEINNPLSTIIGNVELLIDSHGDQDRELGMRLEAILNNSLRIAEIVKRTQDLGQEHAAGAERRGDTQRNAENTTP